MTMTTRIAPLVLFGMYASALRMGTLKADPSPQRQINYFRVDHAGVGDRMAVFENLMALGAFLNATVHLPHGPNWASMYLHKHSAVVDDHWDKYFDVDAPGAPFNEISKDWGKHCKNVDDKETDWRTVFDDGATCINLHRTYWGYKNCDVQKLGIPVKPIALSHSALDLAQKITNGQTDVGLLHIRRCDLRRKNEACTSVDAMYKFVQTNPDISRWFIFHYAEKGYLEKLKSKLSELEGRVFVAEDDISWGDDDNHFKKIVYHALMPRMAVTLETRNCEKRDKLGQVIRRAGEEHKSAIFTELMDSMTERYLSQGVCLVKNENAH